MNKWERVSIVSVANITNESVDEFSGEKIYIATGDLKEVLNDDTSEKVTFDNRPSRANLTARAGEVILAKMKGTDKVMVIDEKTEEYIYSTGFLVLRPKENLNKDFLYFYLRTKKFQKEKDALCTGATQKAISNINFNSLTIPLPPLSLQQEIAERLDKMATLIEKSKAQLSHYDALAESLFIELFGDPITNEKGWQKKKLGEVCEKIGDGLHGTPIYDDTGEYYFINGNNINNKKIKITEKTKRVGYSEYIKNKKNLNANTVFVSINGTLGNVGFYNDEKIILGKSICYLNIKTDIINKDYIHSFLDSDYFKKYANRVATGSTIKNVSLKSMRNLEIPLPPLSLQIKFAEQVENIEEQKTKIRAEIEQAEQGFQALLQESF